MNSPDQAWVDTGHTEIRIFVNKEYEDSLVKFAASRGQVLQLIAAEAMTRTGGLVMMEYFTDMTEVEAKAMLREWEADRE